MSVPRGPAAAETARLFLALWPPAATRLEFEHAVTLWQWPRTARHVAPSRMHATLHFLGAVERARVVAIADGLQVHAAPCVVRFDAAALWPHDLAVIQALQPPQALLDLHAALASRLRALGIAVEARPWRAHVTLARDAMGAVAPSSIAPIDWTVDGYALVESRPGPPVGYEVRRRYALEP